LSLVQRQSFFLDFACLFIYKIDTSPKLFVCLSIYESAETLSHEAQVRGNDVHPRENTSPAGIGLAAEPGGWSAGGGGRARLKSSSRQSSQNMLTLEHAMDLEDSLASLPFRGCTALHTIVKMSGQREQTTTRRGRLVFHAS